MAGAALDHVSLKVGDYRRAEAFYDAALAPLGLWRLFGDGETYAGYGAERPFFWIGSDGRTGYAHVAFAVPQRAEVDAFHAAALAAGGRDNGAPGLREHYHPTYYGAFVLDPDGHNIEAVCHAAA
jgi:catechol 2,3-dioxygenase-like lactoylglutathione lyase family enzyme